MIYGESQSESESESEEEEEEEGVDEDEDENEDWDRQEENGNEDGSGGKTMETLVYSYSRWTAARFVQGGLQLQFLCMILIQYR